ncbi:hypothetical protein ILUMI_09778 [Ignelater luminosus]|uniref:Histone-lysine N-methyltransferase SETMAR n=1 Tax=Ignelater luminosus TaxID=2038154 RepID=A0A8K0GC42_IGNLU|nr:hypothetical protein ILUMI_09778 [Ignelater luminosus]
MEENEYGDEKRNDFQSVRSARSLAMERDFVLTQDNARPHTARCVTAYLMDVDLEKLNGPACSPDKNPAEHLTNWLLPDPTSESHPGAAGSPGCNFRCEYNGGFNADPGESGHESRPKPQYSIALWLYMEQTTTALRPAKIQRLASMCISGTMKTTPTAAHEVFLGLPDFET